MLLDQLIREFLSLYMPSFESLKEALDEARISHYSSGCGNKSVTFDLFPASSHINELLNLLSLDRAYKPRGGGLRDVTGKTGYNPAGDFLLYLRRWTTFAEQAMRNEGASRRGIAAARAKLIMEDLSARLSEGKASNSRLTAFARLMETIGMTLAARKLESETPQGAHRGHGNNNYSKALAAAKDLVSEATDPQPQVA